MQPLNYRHLYYFWVVAKEGGIARAAERLEMAVQTVSTQVRELERSLGYSLFRSLGRGIELTEAGATAVRYAEQIFQLGEALPAAVQEAAEAQGVRLAVGISDALPKPAVRHLLQPAVETPNLRLQCQEGDFDDLLADLALHRLDVVLADRPAPANPNLRVFSHRMGKSSIAWYVRADIAQTVEQRFPACLADLPLLLPTADSAVRSRLDDWLARHGIRPRVVGEFEDSALLATFGESGLGAFPAPELSSEEFTRSRGLALLGRCPDVVEHFYAISAQRKVDHPVIRRLLAGAENASA
ncbi:transcriptional activator NhaR [Aromatoleum toluvorans]|uniref:Transcriptional activator NhaR n=1 Tax=Aromatoleum toluvorans TaxID=92002 RepID=A0ABX1PTX8_9RHOO|nr:transcriptional activator NhaR [Aromatoleum toluvorans]NMG42902.1 transcriptional activator NhaR [Aromatoleum toluvorans]